ncbi:MAG: hypothetical protein PWR07_1922 [Bacillota bacterium]|nr:DUF86 domain-containing protein [Bacillota bacterium]MDK2931791.1 hypothetical protein [Bacillota bacterium]
MIDARRVMEKLDMLGGYVARMKVIRRLSRDEFLADPDKPAAAESYLWRSLEAVFDIGRHILAKTGDVSLAGEYKSIARGLGDRGVVSKSLSEILVQMAGYRNRLVHLYHDVSNEELYAIMESGLPDLERFIREIADFVQRSTDGQQH